METLDHHGHAASVTADIRPLPGHPDTWTGEYAVWRPDGMDGHYHLAPARRSELVEQVYDIASREGAL